MINRIIAQNVMFEVTSIPYENNAVSCLLLSVLEINQFSSTNSTCYAFDGSLCVLDKDSEPSDGFYLLTLITKDILGPYSGAETPTEQVIQNIFNTALQF